MKLLIASYYFAPTNTIAARRLTALARFLRDNGHEVKIITASPGKLSRDWCADLGGIEVIDTTPPRILGFVARVRISQEPRTIRSQPEESGNAFRRWSLTISTWALRLARGAKTTIDHLLLWPDRECLWLLTALPAALRVSWRWRPDLIYASSPPATCMALGALTAKLTRVPWVCEIRDRWADDPYYPRPRWRRAGEHALERLMLGSARGIVTVSETWARDYGASHGKPAIVVYSGFDPAAYENVTARSAPGLPLRIVYTGSVYAGRDPAPLWRALADVGAAADDIRVEFYGARRDEVLPGAAAHGVERLVHVEEYVSHDRAVELQCGADVLLLLQWNNPSEAGNMPGKLFEYLGAGRPILAIGYAEGEMARVIAEVGAGVCANEAGVIAVKLGAWLARKRRTGQVSPLTETIKDRFSRDCEYANLERFIHNES